MATATEFTPASLVNAIRGVFELNNYDVEGPAKIHGAEIDLIARPRTDPFGRPIYIEATVEYVDVQKYGKDLTKLAMLGTADPQSRRLIVSATGFTLDVRERSSATAVECLTYDELFSKFEQFGPYIQTLFSDGGSLGELKRLNEIYEEPLFEDSVGKDRATEFLTAWLANPAGRRWIVVTGEYGTGKTALTKVLQYRWANAYHSNATLPIPFRIELRDFTHQFDARALLHHFLDHNRLSHVSIDFVLSLIRRGRIVLLLDGYDEMAQYMHARERRACLEALAALSTDGARGVLTSRPNYFSEAEELQLFEILYRSVTRSSYTSKVLSETAASVLKKEKDLDTLLESHFVDRFERTLRDLTIEQTEQLIRRILAADPDGQAAVLGILNRVFRILDPGESLNLSGKPVIISYLLEVVESLKTSEPSDEPLSEWQVYRLIVDQLMVRDFRRSPLITPERRSDFLQSLAIVLSQREHPYVDEEQFRTLVGRHFAPELRRLAGTARSEEIERYFADLRGSATLTRTGDSGRYGWKFSHNSLREYFLTRHLVTCLERVEPPEGDVPVTEPMRVFLASLDDEPLRQHQTLLAKLWSALPRRGLGGLFSLLWDGLKRLHRTDEDPIRAALTAVAGPQLNCAEIALSRVSYSGSPEGVPNLEGFIGRSSIFVDVDFRFVRLCDADFEKALLENVTFGNADLSRSVFRGAYLGDVSLVDANVSGADFRNVREDDISIMIAGEDEEVVRIEGKAALGYLAYHDALTDDIPTLHVVRNHPNFGIVDKILRRLGEQGVRQRRGLVQRGAARQDVKFAEDLVDFLEKQHLITTARGRRDLVNLTEAGRDVVGRMLEKDEVDGALEAFLVARLYRDRT